MKNSKSQVKRIVGNVSPSLHMEIKIQSARHDLSMNDVFSMAVMELFKIDLDTMFTSNEIDKYNALKASL